MKIKVSEASPSQLDWLVAKCEGEDDVIYRHRQFGKLLVGMPGDYNIQDSYWPYEPTTSWSQGGPIIDRNSVQLLIDTTGNHFAVQWAKGIGYGPRVDGATALIAAMRCLVIAHLGSEVEVPESLIES